MTGWNPLEGLVRDMLLIGMALGVVLCGILYGLWWVAQHVDISWVTP